MAYAQVDEELFDLLQDLRAIDDLGEAISAHWFDRGLHDLRAVAAASSQISSYERQLRLGLSPAAHRAAPPVYVRDPAFRRVVTHLYDYRCAATGLRVILPGGEAMVQAAHIHPFREAGDDDPRNGVALCPNMHWAMDRNLIAPGPDLKWHVSPALDQRVRDFHDFVQLDGKPLILPCEARLAPKRESLEWRVERLRRELPVQV